jgi:hypothetical protein
MGLNAMKCDMSRKTTSHTSVAVMPTVPISVTTIAQVGKSKETPDRVSWLQVRAGCGRGFVADFTFGHSVCPKPDWYELEERLDIQLAQEFLNGASHETTLA